MLVSSRSGTQRSSRSTFAVEALAVRQAGPRCIGSHPLQCTRRSVARCSRAGKSRAAQRHLNDRDAVIQVVLFRAFGILIDVPSKPPAAAHRGLVHAHRDRGLARHPMCAHGISTSRVPVLTAASRENQICCTAKHAMQVSLHHRFAGVKRENDSKKQHVCS